MTDPDRDRWTAARAEVVARWRQVLERIGARDEGGTLALTTEMDEFCDEAIATRQQSDPTQGAAPSADTPAQAAGPTPMCHFCRGFIQYGGCAGVTREINLAVLSGDWEKARSVAEGYISSLETMDFTAS